MRGVMRGYTFGVTAESLSVQMRYRSAQLSIGYRNRLVLGMLELIERGDLSGRSSHGLQRGEQQWRRERGEDVGQHDTAGDRAL